jgi:uncharacterized SAM-binding protein YcdF (DUF218 family)
MFALSKIFWWFAEPSNPILIGVVLGVVLLWTPWRRAGRWLLTISAFAMIVIAVVPWSAVLIRPLENRFPPISDVPPEAAGIITLGGAVNQFLTVDRGQTSLSGGAERLTTFVALARRYPKLRLVYSGGSGSLTRQDLKETLVARRLFAEIGFDPTRVLYEDRSRNTHENAILTRELVNPAPGERWVLLTSASHMPRAVGVFRKAGWTVIPYPVDYSTFESGGYGLWHGLGSGLSSLTRGLHEWVGLVAYWMLDRTDAVLPGP